jgi:DNA-binding MarR family transcriptional regulator
MTIDLGPGRAVSRRLGYLLKHATAQLHELNLAALEPLGIEPREHGVMLLIADHEPGSQQQAARRLGVDRTTMVAVVDALEGKGLVRRTADPADRRRNLVELTSAGRERLDAATAASDAAERAFLSALDADAAAGLRAALQTVLADAPVTGAVD